MGKLKGRDFIAVDDFSNDEILRVFEVADEMDEALREKKTLDLCKGKILATLFFEPSTRTQFSFQTAIYRLGGNCISLSDMSSTSFAKGESIEDAIKMIQA